MAGGIHRQALPVGIVRPFTDVAARAPLSQVDTVAGELLDAAILGVRDIDVAAGVHRDVIGISELAVAGAAAAPLREVDTAARELLDTTVCGVHHVDVAAGIHRHALWVEELPVSAPAVAPRLDEIVADEIPRPGRHPFILRAPRDRNQAWESHEDEAQRECLHAGPLASGGSEFAAPSGVGAERRARSRGRGCAEGTGPTIEFWQAPWTGWKRRGAAWTGMAGPARVCRPPGGSKPTRARGARPACAGNCSGRGLR